MRRLPLLSFAALALATVGAFFVSQHLKVTTPLLAGAPAPYPGAINPLNGTTCGGLNHRETMISFYLLHRTDDVDVYVIDQTGAIVRTVAVGRHMRRGVRNPDGVFFWNGREDDGALAPDGTYHFRVALIHQGRTVDLSSKPVMVKTVPPRPVVTSVLPSVIPQGRRAVTIRYAGNENRGATVLIYRTDVPTKPRLMKSFLTPWYGHTAVWDGRIRGRLAPAGIYLVGLQATDAACNTGRFPQTLPPAPGTTPHAGVTVRYLVVRPPLVPVAAGGRALAYVDARGRSYRWSLVRAGKSKPAASGSAAGAVLRLAVPPGAPGLYELQVRLRSGTARTAVPLVAHGTRPQRILVVLPALTWQGQNSSDEDGDGLPDTLDTGGPVRLDRPLMAGLPEGYPGEAALLAYLDKAHLPYDLTTDLGLFAGTGPALRGHAAVVLAGSERWLPTTLSTQLRSYVQAGGRVLSLGIDSLRRGVRLDANEIRDPTPPALSDVLGAHIGSVVTHNTAPLTVISDGLGIFSGTPGALPDFSSYQPTLSVSQPSQIVSEAGTSESDPSIVAYTLGRGTVVDIGLPDFGVSLARSPSAQELVKRLWAVLSP